MSEIKLRSKCNLHRIQFLEAVLLHISDCINVYAKIIISIIIVAPRLDLG